jgi:caa(3)-type oxidase subunit IV
MTIFVVLVILTALEFATAIGLKGESTFTIMVILLLGMAFTKAGLVAAYFMHLRFERKLFVLIVSAPLILAVILVIALLPDIGYMSKS